jgi:hypothetical protein
MANIEEPVAVGVSIFGCQTVYEHPIICRPLSPNLFRLLTESFRDAGRTSTQAKQASREVAPGPQTRPPAVHVPQIRFVIFPEFLS